MRMLWQYAKAAVVLLCAGLVVLTGAQESEEDTGKLPGIFGVFGMHTKLTADPDGYLTIVTDAKTRKLVSIVAQKNVRLDAKDRDLYLSCERLVYDGEENKLIATGHPVSLKMQGTNATCGYFEYFPETRRSELSIDPVIYNEDPEGGITTTTGSRIIIEQNEEGLSSMIIKGEGKVPVELVLAPGEEIATADRPTTPTGAVKIDETNMDDIKTLEVVE